MSTLESDFGGIAAGLFLSTIGLIAVVISLFRLKSKDFSLFNFGLFCSLNGVRWLVEIPAMKTLVGFPFTFPYFHGLLTYAIVIPFCAFLVDIFGRGIYSSLLWVFRSTIVYAVAAVGYDMLSREPLSDVSVNPVVVVLWCLVGIVNVLFSRAQDRGELRVLRVVFLITLVFTTIDNFTNIRTRYGGGFLEHAVFLAMCTGLGYVAVHHLFSNERKLLAIEHEIEIARRIQTSNLPDRIRSPGGVEIVARYVPMTTVAGDFYDVHVDGHGGVGILIADVSGHGIGAALIGSMLKVAYASQQEHLANPARVLTEINRILQGKMEDSFITACSLYIDTASDNILYANAGHPSPMLWKRSTKAVCRFPPGGTILGPFPEALFENAAQAFAEGDRLVLFTDGVIETRSKSGELFGDERMEAFIGAHSQDKAEATAGQLIEHLNKWSGRSYGTSLDDDLTFIIVDMVSNPAHPVSIPS